MASVCFGRSVNFIDDIPLSMKEIDLRDTIGPMIYKFLFNGYILTSIYPSTLFNPKLNEKKTINLKPIPLKNYLNIQNKNKIKESLDLHLEKLQEFKKIFELENKINLNEY